MPRNYFDSQLEKLHIELIQMGALCEEGIHSAIRFLMENDETMAQKAISTEVEIDHKEREIESICMKLLLQQQPVAKDLRIISSALKMISDMERIGDQASDIVEAAKYVTEDPMLGMIHIREMSENAAEMVTKSIDSFVKSDVALAKRVLQDDDIVDRYLEEIKDELVQLLMNNSKEGESCLELLMIAKYLERIGDHACNIAEWVIFSVTGEHVH